MKNLFFLQAFFFLVAYTNAQVVNIESQRFRTDTVGWKGSANIGFSMGKQKEKYFIVNSTAHVQYKSKKHLYLLLGNYELLKSQTSKIANAGFLHFRHNYKLKKDWIRWESFTQAQFNRVNGLKVRFLLGSGPRFKALDLEKYKIYIGTLYMYEHEQSIDNLSRNNECRFSGYVSFSFYPTENLEFISTTYYQPNVAQNKDYRIATENSILLKILKNLSFAMNFRLNYDTRPPSGAATDITYLWSNSLKIVF